MITLRFVASRDLASDLVLLGEHDGWATHVEALMPDGTLLGSLLEGGVQARPMGYDKGAATRELYVSFESGVTLVPQPHPIPVRLLEKDEAFYAFLRAQIGKPYDKLGIVGFVFGRGWHAGGSWFCSELQTAALEACGYFYPLASLNSHVSPRDLLLVLSSRIPIPNMAGTPL